MRQTNSTIDFWPLLLWVWVAMAAVVVLRPPLLWVWEYARSVSASDNNDKAPAPMVTPNMPEALSQPWTSGPVRPAPMLALEKAIFDKTNDQRRLVKTTPTTPALKSNPGLAEIAAQHSAAMRDKGFFAHSDPTGVGPSDRAAKGMRTAFGTAAENIAKVTDQQNLADEFMDGWMNSLGHRKNILDLVRTDLGIGCAEAKAGDPQKWVHCTQLFMALYASLKQPFPETVKAGQSVNVEIVPENRNPVPARLRQSDVKTNAIVAKADLRTQSGNGVGTLSLQGPAGVYRLDVEIPDPGVPSRFSIVPGPYVTVTPP